MTRTAPATLRRRLSQTGDLIRLAELRRDLARVALASARAALAQALAAVDTAREVLRQLDAEQQARRDVLVQPMIGSMELRGSLQGVLNTLEGDRERIHQAEAAIEAALAEVEKARAGVEDARKALLAAERRLQVRQHLRAPLVEERNHQIERADEMEAEERRLVRAARRVTL